MEAKNQIKTRLQLEGVLPNTKFSFERIAHMKTWLRVLFRLTTLMPGLGSMLAGGATAETFTTLYSFSPSITNSLGVYTNSDGALPDQRLLLSGNTLYGTAFRGGSSGNGTVFKVNTDGTGFTNLYTFTAGRTNSSGAYTNGDGVGANSLVLTGNTLYGAAYNGGSFGNGTIFAINTDGTAFTTLHSFTATAAFPPQTNSDGAFPHAGVILSDNTLYGTAVSGGYGHDGTVFSVNTNGTGFTTLHSFGALDTADANSDGANPVAGLISSNNRLYGTAKWGGSWIGTVFAINTDGTGFTTLHSFSAGSANSSGINTNSDGGSPYAGLVLSGNTLYGTAGGSGSSGNGTLFSVNTDGTGFTTVHSFTADPPPFYTNSDGANPESGLVLSGNTLYGTTFNGGSSGNGVVFAVNTDGTGFTTLYNFTALSASYPYTNSDGAGPVVGLVLTNNTLYGTTPYGGSGGNGTIFSLSFTPRLSITPSGPNVILSWPTNYAGFDYSGYILQSATNLAFPLWTTNSLAPVVNKGQNTLTIAISGTQQFFRLSQ